MRTITGRAALERRLDGEVQFHVDMLTAHLERTGVPAADARRQALVAFGGRERFKDDTRDAIRSRVLHEIVRDARYGLRVLGRHPGFTAAAIATFALGVGATTAVYSIVDGVLLRPLPYADPDRLVVVWERNLRGDRDRNVVSVASVERWRADARTLSGLTAIVPAPVTITIGGHADRVAGAQVSPGYFHLLGIAPFLGREFTAGEGAGGGADVVVLSHGFWMTRFAGDSGVIGRTVPIGGRAHTVIGVMPAGFDPPRFFWLGDQDLWLPFAATPQTRSWGRFLLVIARLAPGASLGAARAELAGIAERQARVSPADQGWSTTVVTLEEQITGDVRTPLVVLLAAVGLLLMMAVTNVGNLSLTLARRRAREMDVRRALGASTARLVRQQLVQSLVLGLFGGIAGLAIAALAVGPMLRFVPTDVPRATTIRLDGPVVLVSLALTVAATILFGCVAAWRGIPRHGTPSLGTSGARVTSGGGGASVVVAEIALGLVIAVVAGLMARTFQRLRAVDLGFTPEPVLVARVGLTGERYRAPASWPPFFEALLARTRAIRGVDAASFISTRPFGGEGPATIAIDAARPGPAGPTAPVTDVRYVESDVFRTLGIPLLDGPGFDPREHADGPPRVVINRALARALWGSDRAIGRRVRVEVYDGVSAEVVGVVADVHLIDARTPSRPTAWLSDARFPSEMRDLVVRVQAGADRAVVLDAVRAVVADLDPGVPLFRVGTMRALVEDSLARDRFATLVLGAFAIVALLLAGVGIYGVCAGDVASRRQEIGIRRALGAPSSGVAGLVLRRTLGRALAGIALGTALALSLGRVMATMLYGVRAADPVSFVVVALLLVALALLATLVPALRAARVSPLVAMRGE